MKKIILSVLLIMLCFYSFSQEIKPSNSEIKINVLYLLAGIPEIGYEYVLNEESGIGIDVLFSIDNDMDPSFALTPYYRFYFGKKRAAGFFAEGFGMLNAANYNNDYSYDENIEKTETDFALGVSVGGKFITNKNFIFEIYGGIGRNLFNENAEDVVPRFGLTFGKRF